MEDEVCWFRSLCGGMPRYRGLWCEKGWSEGGISYFGPFVNMGWEKGGGEEDRWGEVNVGYGCPLA